MLTIVMEEAVDVATLDYAETGVTPVADTNEDPVIRAALLERVVSIRMENVSGDQG